MSSNIPYSEFSRIRNRTANIENIEGGTSINGTLRAYSTILGPTPYPFLNPYEYLQISNTINNDAFMTVRNTNVTGILGVLNDNAFVGTVNNKDFHFRINNNAVGIIKNTGDFGIGNLNPQVSMSIGPTTAAGINSNEMLQLNNTLNNDVYMTVRSNEAIGYYGANADTVYIGSFSNDRFVLSSNGTTRACITANGNFGIGTNFLSADALLHVNGSAKFEGTSTFGTTILKIDVDNQVVGINTSTPDASYWLDVNGASKFNGSIQLNSHLYVDSGYGIRFGNSENASTLDDYEEGTWTPSFATDGSGLNISSYTAQSGSYVKIGKMVLLSGKMDIGTLVATGSGNVLISGIPVAAASDTTYQYYYSGLVTAYINMGSLPVGAAAPYEYRVQTTNDSTKLVIRYSNNNTIPTSVLNSNTMIWFNIVYKTT